MKKSELIKMIKEEYKNVVKEEYGGYIEMMGPDFDKATDLLEKSFRQWAKGPLTQREDIKYAQSDLIEFFTKLVKKNIR